MSVKKATLLVWGGLRDNILNALVVIQNNIVRICLNKFTLEGSTKANYRELGVFPIKSKQIKYKKTMEASNPELSQLVKVVFSAPATQVAIVPELDLEPLKPKGTSPWFITTTNKNKNKQKTKYENIYLALLNLKTFCEDQSLNKLAMNKLGFNDKLEWAQFEFRPLVTTLSGNTYILTLQDDLTKYSMGIALPNHQANTIAEAFVTNVVCTHGIPQIILTNKGTDFLICKLLQINKINTSPFHPQTNSSLERSHRMLTEYLKALCRQKTQQLGRKMQESNENSIEIHVKDQILLRDKTQKNKLNPLWIGPYEVTDVLDRENIREEALISRIIITCFTLQMALTQTKPYRILRLTQENGMYFENQGPLRLTNSNWKLLIYVKLDSLEQEVSRKRFYM
ncbi:igE-binding protein-like [Aphis craccivora]|uniref:IgE-binding protein-like n=1 Tax=Aphis craccivora TaxID=307492 RepID=A0A6G0W5X8_APHCR|nr:igE-binding protein-like [Aphis craccivora]